MAEGAAELCVCVLFYGADDYCCELARRVLNRPMRELGETQVEFRFGFNAVSPATQQVVAEFTATSDYVVAAEVVSPVNIYKYPMMRRLLAERPMTAPRVMWFDDNSYLDPDLDVRAWLPRVFNQLDHCAVMGSVYTQGLVGKQADWIRAQPWFNGRDPAAYVKYPAGGWWVAQTEVLQRFDWPPSNIKHHGGDVMLGELLRQHELPLCHFRDGVMIQANASGVESASVRRGFNAPPVGCNYPHED
jgi:hypothetical protein